MQMKIRMFLLDGTGVVSDNIEEAIGYAEQNNIFEVIVTYNNGTIIQGQFKEKDETVDFLEKIR